MLIEAIHVLYGGAQRVRPGWLPKLNSLIYQALRDFAPDHPVAKLATGSVTVQDFRVDFEDGFGQRTEAEEDACARSISTLCKNEGYLPPQWGVRLKPFGGSTHNRSLRTLEILCEEQAPPIVTLPKIQSAAEVDELASWLDRRGAATRLELMVETAAALRDLPGLIAASHGRCDSLHFGAYDLLSELGVPGPAQGLQHAFCAPIRLAMHLAVAGTGVRVVDGVTSLLPVGPQARDGWNLHMANVRHALEQGFFAGWDVHPAQVAARAVALYDYYHEHQAALAARLAQYLEAQAQATRVGAAFDDAATVRGLARFFLRGLDCGALAPADVAFSRQQLQAHL